MGYYSTLYGSITFDPPLVGDELAGYPIKGDGHDGYRSVALEVVEERDDTAEGYVVRRVAREIVPATDEDIKAYDLPGSFTELVAKLGARTFEGEIRIEGEAAGDVQRLLVVDGRAAHWKASLLWPDGSTEPGR